MQNILRRLPIYLFIYLLLDCSGSMMGESIEALKQGVKTLLTELKGDPQAVETAYLSVITFNSSAQQIIPLTELVNFKEPDIEANGATALGKALTLLIECIDREVHKTTNEQKGDWRPLVFILTDGSPSDTEEFNKAIKILNQNKVANIIACAAGSKANTTYLKQITNNVLMMNTISAGDMAQFFEWVSGSIKVSSKKIDAKQNNQIELPLPPEGFVVIM